MGKLNTPQRAKRYSDNNFSDAPDITIKHAACAGFRAGFEAHKRDVRERLHDLEDELLRRFSYLSKMNMWHDYEKRKNDGEFDFVRGIKRATK